MRVDAFVFAVSYLHGILLTVADKVYAASCVFVFPPRSLRSPGLNLHYRYREHSEMIRTACINAHFTFPTIQPSLNRFQQCITIHMQFLMHCFQKVNIRLLFAIHDLGEFGITYT